MTKKIPTKIWVVAITEVMTDDGIYNLYTNLFEKETDARKFFEEKKEEQRKDFLEAKLEIETEETEDTFEIWEDGYFSQNHTIIKITKLEVN